MTRPSWGYMVSKGASGMWEHWDQDTQGAAVSTPVMAELTKYVSKLNTGQEKLFNDNLSHKQWRKICKKAGLTDLKFHDLHKTFGSMLAQKGISTAVTQKLLEHSSPRLTNKVYTNVDSVLRHAVEQLPVGDWL